MKGCYLRLDPADARSAYPYLILATPGRICLGSEREGASDVVAPADSFLGTGVYGFTEAGRLTHVNPQTVRAWFRGRYRAKMPVGRGRVFQSQYESAAVISFLDLIEVLVAGQLRLAGVPLSAIRRAYAAISEHLSTPHPFSRRELPTDGQRIFVHTATSTNEEQLLEIIRRQHFFPKVMLPYLNRVVYDDVSKLARCWNIMDGVVVDPGRSRGKPVVEATGIPASVLAAAYSANGRDADAVADWYGVAVEDVTLAVQFAENYSGGRAILAGGLNPR